MTDRTTSVRNPFSVLLKAGLLLVFFQILLGGAVTIGGIIEGREPTDAQQAYPLIFADHRVLAWTGLFLLLAAIPVSGLIIRFITRHRSPEFYFLDGSLRKTLAGFLIGAALPVALTGLLLPAGCARVIAAPDRLNAPTLVASIIGFILLMLFVAIYEEFIFRGFLTCEWSLHSRHRAPAIIISGLLFGAMHLLNIETSRAETVRIVLSGLNFSWLLTAVMLATRSLGTAIGLHAGWNYSLGCLLGLTVSGHRLNMTLFVTEIAGPDWLTGGRFGLETSLPANLMIGILAVIAMRFARGEPAGRDAAAESDEERSGAPGTEELRV